MEKKPRVVIVGAGFGGLAAARSLSGSPMDVLIIDRNNFHTFHPLLYQVASAELEPEHISYPVRSIIRKMPNVHFMMGDVQSIDYAKKEVNLPGRTVPYDYLVLASGSISRFFDIPGVGENAFELKTLEHATRLRNHILCCLEEAVSEPYALRRQQLLTFVVVGGGPTGVEFAGALAELLHGPVVKDYPLPKSEMKIILLQGMDSLLPDLPARLRLYTFNRLTKMGIEVRLNTLAGEISAQGVKLAGGEVILAGTVVWTAGVRGDSLAESSGLPVARDGRVLVLPTLQAPGVPGVYVIGDLAYMEKDGHPLPYIAPVALQEGRTAAFNILRQVAGQPKQPFRYRQKGALATIGRGAAVVQLGRREFKGFPAWVLWLAVHIYNLIGFRNRLLVILNWAWDFLFFERAVRVILPSECKPKKGQVTK